MNIPECCDRQQLKPVDFFPSKAEGKEDMKVTCASCGESFVFEGVFAMNHAIPMSEVPGIREIPVIFVKVPSDA